MKKLISLFLSVCMILSSVAVCCTVASAADEDDVYTSGDFKYKILSDGTAEISGYIGNERAVTVPESIDSRDVVSIGYTAFFKSLIYEINIPSSVKKINWWAFYDSKNLSKVQLSDGLRTICYGAFMNCPNLRSLSVPATVTQIGDDSIAVKCTTRKDVFDIYSKKQISTQQYETDNGFVMSGYSGTAAEKYAEDNSLNFNSQGNVMYGDIDGNGKIDSADVDLAKKFVSRAKNPDKLEMAAADVDNDGLVTDNDVKLISGAVTSPFTAKLFPSAKAFYTAPDYLSGKTMYCDGDSVAYGTGTDIMGNSLYSYCNYISEKYNMQMVNRAVAGTTIAKRKQYDGTSQKSILERVREMQGNYDVVLLDGGFNDLFKKVKMGEMTDYNDRSGVYDEYTTAGALESICYFLNENYTDSIKLFVLCHKRFTNPKQPKYWALIKNILDKWDIPYVDVSEETELADDNSELSDQYYRFDKGGGDGIHPLAYTNMKIYGPVVAEKLNSLAQSRSQLVLSENDITMGMFESCSIDSSISGIDNSVSLSWSSDDDSVATVDANGRVTATGLGKTVISVCSEDGKTAAVNVTVKLPALTLSLGEKKISLREGDTYVINSTVLDDEASYSMYYSSENPDVAVIDENTGLITALKKGKAVITCKTASGVTAKSTVKVSERKDIRPF